MATFGNAKKSGHPRKAPKVSKYNFDDNYMQENTHATKGKSPMSPLSRKKLSK